MSTQQVFETLIQFTGDTNPGSFASTGDIAAPIVALLAAVAVCAALVSAFALKRAYANGCGVTFVAPVQFVKTHAVLLAVLIATVLAVIVGVMTFAPQVNAFADSSYELKASVSDKIAATVDADGSVTVASGTIANTDSTLAVGVRRISTSTTADLGSATMKISIGGKEVYSGTVGSEIVLDDYVTVAKSATDEITYDITMPAEKAKALVGTAPITVKTTVDVVSSPTGKVVDKGNSNAPIANATVQASWTDPYTQQNRTFDATTDINGSYSLGVLQYGLDIDVEGTVSGKNKASVDGVANESQVLPDIKLRDPFLTFTAVDAGAQVKASFNTGTWQYSTDDGVTWSALISPQTSETITLTNVGDQVLLRGTGCTTSTAYHFNINSGKVAASGDVTSLTNGTGGVAQLSYFCYSEMFRGCTSLTTAPALPATSLDVGCYQNMFAGCTSLTCTPALPAANLSGSCYECMFSGCTSLVSVAEISATECSSSSCCEMFYGCSSLKVVENGSGTAFFTCPNYSYRDSVEDMFYGTGGTFTGTPTAGNTYYYTTTQSASAPQNGLQF